MNRYRIHYCKDCHKHPCVCAELAKHRDDLVLAEQLLKTALQFGPPNEKLLDTYKIITQALATYE